MVEKPDEQQFISQLGVRLRSLREEKGLSSADMARALYMERGNYSRIETGKTNPTILTLYRISKVLSIPLDKILSS